MADQTGTDAAHWVENFDKLADPPACEYGHYGCSCSKKPEGPCLIEMLSRVRLTHQEEAGGFRSKAEA